MNIFDMFSSNAPRRNKFDLSHEKKLTLNMGDLVPVLAQEVLPGDSFRVNAELMARVAPMLAPMLHRVRIYVHFHFVPYRLIWKEWEDFRTGGRDGLAQPVAPYIMYPTAHGGGAGTMYHGKGSVADYFGLPTSQTDYVSGLPPVNQKQINALPFRAYALIYDQLYRDQNVEPELVISKDSGQDNEVGMIMRKRAWEKDYFTSCLPNAQRGPEVSMPMNVNYTSTSQVKDAIGGGNAADGNLTATNGLIQSATGPQNVRVENIDQVSVTINDLRKAARLQEFFEKMARGGARYVEYLKQVFGVRSSDSRLQRVEFLGGGVQPLVVSEVLSTYTNVTDSIPQGNMTGHGISVGSSNGFTRTFEEDGIIIGLVSVLPTTAYQQGIHRMWERKTKFDYFTPDFAHIGEQEVKSDELYFNPDESAPTNPTFGYQSRYAEYKYQQSTVHGDFRDNMAYWHMGRIFSAKPVLNANFIKSDPTTRVFAVTDPAYHHVYLQMHFNISALRPMPYFGIPGL